MSTTIDAENAKQIRKQMDVLIKIEPASGDPIIINNENLIKAVVSLRSDLSIINPTLPESELNVEAYFDDDISETLGEIPNETPITYQAGYTGDMSPVRKFYLAEQITRKSNVIKIHAVDAVHRLEKAPVAAIKVGRTSFNPDSVSESTSPTLGGLLDAARYLLWSSGVEYEEPSYIYLDTKSVLSFLDVLIIDRVSKRKIIADVMNLFHEDYNSGFLYSDRTFWPSYVDAGIPSLKVEKPASIWDIYEEDCADFVTNASMRLTGIKATLNKANYLNFPYSSGEWILDSGAFIDYPSDYCGDARFYCTYTKGGQTRTFVVGSALDGIYYAVARLGLAFVGNKKFSAQLLLGKNVEKGPIVNTRQSVEYEVNTQVMPWSSEQENLWDNYVDETGEVESVELAGRCHFHDKQEYTKMYGSNGNVELVDSPSMWGQLITYGKSSDQTPVEAFPAGAYNSLLQRSNITGSFTWKGDPRMQPRDVFTFHRLDGTEEDCTLENITITHEKGGTIAEITYRKGIC